MLKEELVRKKISLAEQGSKRGFTSFGRKGRQLRKSTMMLCHVERKSESLHVTITVKSNKKCFYKYSNNRRRAKEDIYPILEVEGSIVTKGEGKTEVLDAFLASSSTERTLILRGAGRWGQGSE